jgi:hypothetical protein
LKGLKGAAWHVRHCEGLSSIRGTSQQCNRRPSEKKSTMFMNTEIAQKALIKPSVRSSNLFNSGFFSAYQDIVIIVVIFEMLSGPPDEAP